jgi:hypothetical protein
MQAENLEGYLITPCSMAGVVEQPPLQGNLAFWELDRLTRWWLPLGDDQFLKAKSRYGDMVASFTAVDPSP